MQDWAIPLSKVMFDSDEEEAVLRVLRSDWHSMGPEVERFEKEFAESIGTNHAIAVSSATGALHMALKALDIKPGDEVIQPALNFVAAANVTVSMGAIPVFADIRSPEEPTIDPEDIRRRVTERTKAVVVMHYGGYLCRMDEIAEDCRSSGIALVEDACHALGAGNGYGKKWLAGRYGDVSCFSFYSNKNIATGEGGMACTNRSDLAECLYLLRSHGISSGAWQRYNDSDINGYDVVMHGYNYRMDEIRAAIGRVQLGKLPGFNTRREKIVGYYWRRLSNSSDWMVPFHGYNGESAHHLMVAVASNADIRERALMRLKDEKIQTSHHYPSISDLQAFKGYKNGGLEKTDKFSSLSVTLPLYPDMTERDVDLVCDVLLGV